MLPRSTLPAGLRMLPEPPRRPTRAEQLSPRVLRLSRYILTEVDSRYIVTIVVLVVRGVVMHPEIAKTLVEQRRDELTRHTAESRQAGRAGQSWLGRHLPRWHVSWTRTILSTAGGPGTAG